MEKRRGVITGLGAVTPLGLTMENSWQAVRRGVCGVGPISQYDASTQKVKLAAEVRGFEPETYMSRAEARHMSRFTQFAVAAAKQALERARLTAFDPDRCGVIVSSGIGGQIITEAEHLRGMEREFDRVSPFYIPTAISNMAAGQVAIAAGFRGMCACPVTACAGGSNGVGDAFPYRRDGYADAMLCGGTEACITPLAIGGFTSMKALTQATDPQRTSIQFDAERSGFVMSEGACVLLLESLEHAVARGAQIIAEVAGYGATCDAYHMTAPAPDGAGAARAMEVALRDGGVAAEEIGYINAQGTSTQLNDACETAAVRAAFGAHADKLMVSSTKSMTGHMLGAAGAVEAAFTALALRDGFILATINFRNSDPACDLDIVANEGRVADIRAAMSNSLGFGGHNVSLVLRRWEEA